MGFLGLPSDPGKIKITVRFVTIGLQNIPITNSMDRLSASRPAVKIGLFKIAAQIVKPVGSAASRQTAKVTSKEFATVRMEVTKSAISEGQRLNNKPSSPDGCGQRFLIHRDCLPARQSSANR